MEKRNCYLPDKELFDGGTSEQWWVEMQVEMRELLLGGIVVGRRLMNTHRIREGATE